MSETHSPASAAGPLAGADKMSALFANLVIQQTNLTLMLLGKVPNPDTGERVQDLDAARMFIDQLEMLECKTKGNLDKREEQLLKQSLMSLRMAFVEAVPTPGSPPKETPPAGGSPAAAPSAGETPAASPPEEEHRKKFSKKY